MKHQTIKMLKIHTIRNTKDINYYHLAQTKSQSHFIMLKLVVICSQPTAITNGGHQETGDNSPACVSFAGRSEL
jgi:hypothetical protein